LITGSFAVNDLQQLATGTIDTSELAMTVMAEVCSIYSWRNEACINAGVLALTRESGPLAGIARVRDPARDGWIVARVSQEHGILAFDEAYKPRRQVEDDWKVGDKIELDVQHTCIVAAAYSQYFITDEAGIVIDIWRPWKLW
jgi:D-serine deaminase-like pyridoxal phosphate-dependent protein